jgi:hypothetical protein
LKIEAELERSFETQREGRKAVGAMGEKGGKLVRRGGGVERRLIGDGVTVS